MRYRAIIKRSAEWWFGWLVDLPGVNGQEKTKKELIESLKIGAEDMLLSEIDFQPDAEMVTIEIPDPMWGAQGTS